MKFMQLMIMVFGLAVAGAAVGPGSATDAEMPLVQAELLSDHVAARPGGTVMVGVRFDIAPEWHIY